MLDGECMYCLVKATKAATANQARIINRYKNTKRKVLKRNSNAYFNKQYSDDTLTPKHADIKIRIL